MINIRIAIVEDDSQCVKVFRELLDKYSQKKNYNFIVEWFKNGMDFISDYEPIYDIVFLDINMPHLDGIETARMLRKQDNNVALIFMTNLVQYAVKGYEFNALDFMVKPLKSFDLEMKLNKAIDFTMSNHDRSILLNMGDVLKKISVFDLLYIEVINHTLIYHTEKSVYKVYGQLKKIEEELVNLNFYRCNNSYLINLRHVMEIHGDYIVVGKDRVPLSRRKKKEFMIKLAEFMGQQL